MRSLAILLGLGACATLGIGVLVVVFSTSPVAAQADNQRCAAMAQLSGNGFKVLEARSVKAGLMPAFVYDPATRVPDHCLVRGSFGKRVGVSGRTFEIRFELRMPDNWNGRFLFEGGANMDGVDWPAYGTLFGRETPSALERGFAVVRTNSGHTSPNNDSTDGTWALDQQARIDYAFHALDLVTVKAKQLVSAYYGHPAKRSYFMGCSNGGRQALLAAERYPTYFDGIVAGNAAFNLIRISPRLVWNKAVLSRIAKPKVGAFSRQDVKLVADAVVKKCDALDGLADGLIQDISACQREFDVGELTCKSKKNASCLTPEQVKTYRELIEGPKDPQGRPYYLPLPYNSGPALMWSGSKAADSRSSDLFTTTIRYLSTTPPDPTLDARDVKFPDIFKSIQGPASMMDAEATMLNSFASHGKFIIYHGSSDYALSSFAIAHWYNELAKANPQPTQDWARLFLVPGMGHCDGGHATDDFDPLAAIVNWVERGKAPNRIVATGKSMPGISRPLCPWPKVARYNGGNSKRASSFECR